VATYIPELAKADPATFGMGLATLDGQVYTAGELVPFTIQSVSKPFVYALALTPEAYADLHEKAPAACAARTRAIARSLSQRLRYSTADVAAFEET